jgi:hypothetical protein
MLAAGVTAVTVAAAMQARDNTHTRQDRPPSARRPGRPAVIMILVVNSRYAVWGVRSGL